MFLVTGILAALVERATTGKGNIVDAAIIGCAPRQPDELGPRHGRAWPMAHRPRGKPAGWCRALLSAMRPAMANMWRSAVSNRNSSP